MKSIVVVSPHPDDETLGCGGTLLKHRDRGDKLHWIIVTGISETQGFERSVVEKRSQEIEEVSAKYEFESVHQLDFPTTKLDQVGMGDLVAAISKCFNKIQPHTLYVPNRGDVHTDHKYVFDAVISCTKWFRYPSVKRVLAYETLSETEFSLDPNSDGFKPNVYIDISPYLLKKIEIMNMYKSEMGAFPFPRSEKAMESLATIRGAASGFESAEAFMLLKEIWS